MLLDELYLGVTRVSKGIADIRLRIGTAIGKGVTAMVAGTEPGRGTHEAGPAFHPLIKVGNQERILEDRVFAKQHGVCPG